jgi:predicted PurR-regulated permease PerM
MERRVVTISWTALWRIFIFAIFASVLFLGKDFILALFLALVISSGLERMITFMEERHVPRTLSVIVVFLLGALFVAVLVYFVIPFILVDVNNLLAGDNELLIGRLLSPLRGTEAGRSLTAALNSIAGDFLSKNGSPLGFFSQALGGAILAITVLISSFYLSITKGGVERFIRAVFPRASEGRVLRVYNRAQKKIGFWLQAQIALTLIMWVLVWIALALLGVPHSFVLGIIAGFLELMPFVGPIISGALAVLIALSVSAKLAFYTLLVFLVLQQIEAHFLVPLVTKRAVDLHPVIVIIALLIGFEINGILGALVAVPLAAVIQEIIEARAEETEAEQAEGIL